jgi:hypothetical protein
MSEKFPARPHQSIDENAHSNNEQNASVGKAGECSSTGQSASGQQPTTDEQRENIRKIYEQGQALKKMKPSGAASEEVRKRLLENKAQQFKDAKVKYSETLKPSSRSSSASIPLR